MTNNKKKNKQRKCIAIGIYYDGKQRKACKWHINNLSEYTIYITLRDMNRTLNNLDHVNFYDANKNFYGQFKP